MVPSAYDLAASLALHVVLSWLATRVMGLGLLGASLTLVVGQFAYIAWIPRCRATWAGFTWAAFADLPGFAWLSAASAVMPGWFTSLYWLLDGQHVSIYNN